MTKGEGAGDFMFDGFKSRLRAVMAPRREDFYQLANASVNAGASFLRFAVDNSRKSKNNKNFPLILLCGTMLCSKSVCGRPLHLYHVRFARAHARTLSSMNLAQLLSVDQIIPEVKSIEYRGAIAELVDHLDDRSLPVGITKPELIEQFYRREELVSTGVGSGVAIPHTFAEGLDRVITVFGRSRGGIDFGSHDNAPVYFVVLFVVPKSEYQLHLKTLAAIAKMFSSGDIRQSLAAAADAADILDILAKRPART